MGAGYRTVEARCSRDSLNRCVFEFFLKHPFLMHQSLKRALVNQMYVFVYIQEFGFYLLFGACQSKENP